MIREIKLEVIKTTKNIVEAYSSSYIEGGYQQGTITFNAKLDGRKKSFDPMKVLESAGLIKNISSDEDMFPQYISTNKFDELFVPSFIKFTDDQVLIEKDKIDKAAQKANVTNDEAWHILALKNISNLELFNHSVDSLANLIKQSH